MALLQAEDIVVSFGGHMAVNKASIAVEPGRVTGLIGPNGAGKTTTFNALTGLQDISGGSVVVGDTDVTGQVPYKRARQGVARTFQRLETFTLLTVRENILAGAEFRKRWAKDRGFDTATETERLIERLNLVDVAEERVDGLPTGRARMVEVARALASRPKLLLLDEPASGLDETETDEFAVVLRQLAGDGLGILMVEHDMGLVMDVCDEIFVLDFGAIIAHGTPAEIRADLDVQAAYLGSGREDAETAGPGSDIDIDIDAVSGRPRSHLKNLSTLPGGSNAQSSAAEPGPSMPHAASGAGTASVATTSPVRGPRSVPGDPQVAPLLAVEGLSAGYGDFDVISGVDFSMGTGEVFALLGPNGGGKTTTLKVIAGLVPASGGSVALCGKNVTGADPAALARAGLCLVPEGRGVFANLTVAENLWMATHAGAGRAEVEEKAYARFSRLGERRTQVAGTLSGGEQQMLAMARALSTDPAMLIIDELSMGLAPLIVRDLYDQVAELASSGLSILLVEQFAHEVLGFTDRAAIMVHGRVQKVGSPDEIAAQLEDAVMGGGTE